nr:flotillin domain-containing protein [Streptococcus cuniculi]
MYETQKEADARKAQVEAEKFAQLQEAEAKGLLQKAEAMKQMQDAAITEMVVNVLPEIAKNVAAPLTNVDSITMYSEGNSAKMVGDVMNTMSQVTEGMGIDIKELITATLTGRAIAENTEEQA